MIKIILCTSVIDFIDAFIKDVRFDIKAVFVEERFYAADLISFQSKHKFELIPVKSNLDIQFNVNRYNSDFLLMFGFGIILQRSTLNLIACINLHMGILPFYRGRHVVFHALMNEDTKIGMTLHKVDENIDTGEIIEIFEIDNSHELHNNYFIDNISIFTNSVLNSIFEYVHGHKVREINNIIGCYYPRIDKIDITLDLESDNEKKLLKLNKIMRNSGFYVKKKDDEYKVKNIIRVNENKEISGDTNAFIYDDYGKLVNFVLSGKSYSFDLM